MKLISLPPKIVCFYLFSFKYLFSVSIFFRLDVGPIFLERDLEKTKQN